ncbi:helix-turn-helix transcriptional regulator [Salana multivorans]
MRERTSDRVARLLAMIAYLATRGDVPLADLAEHFGVSQAQARKDVETLWMTGNPGYLHGDLIDFQYDRWEEGRVSLLDSQGMERPVRLGHGEAVALVVALRAIAELPGLAGPALTSALEKLTAAAGDAAVTASVVTAGRPAAADAPQVAAHLATVREALAAARRLDLVYVNASDVVTERTVEPLALLSDGDQWYLRAFCLRAGDVRHFRLDRVVSATLTDVPSERRPEPVDADTVRPRGREEVVLTLSPRARWVAERFGGTITGESDGAITVSLEVADPAWLDALALDLGPDLRALTPPVHARRVATAARRALAAYELIDDDTDREGTI